MIRKLIDPSTIEMPNWVDEQLLTVNRYSRPGTNIPVINGIVIHYVANPGTTAQQNHDYFEGLKDQSGSNTVSVSSNFVIGLDGEIIECVPVGEKAYASMRGMRTQFRLSAAIRRQTESSQTRRMTRW